MCVRNPIFQHDLVVSNDWVPANRIKGAGCSTSQMTDDDLTDVLVTETTVSNTGHVPLVGPN